MYKALKDFAWCIDFKKVVFEKDEEFDFAKVKYKDIIDEMIENNYVKEIISEEAPVKTLQEMTKVELQNYAEKEFGVILSGSKADIISNIENLMERKAESELEDDANFNEEQENNSEI